ncbi:putative reverse transcriptase domain-containing protein [Tanacetum coccineum]
MISLIACFSVCSYSSNENQNGNAVNDNIQRDVRNVACNLKEYDGKGGAIVYTHWIEKMESVQDMSRCGDDQKVKYTAGSFVVKDLTWFHELARLVYHLVTLKNRRIERYIYGLAPQIRGMVAATEPTTIQKAEPSKDRNVKDDNTRIRTGNAFATTANPVRREFTSATPKHLDKDCRVVPRVVNPVNARNPTDAHGACFECGGTDHFKAGCPRLNQAQRLRETVQTKMNGSLKKNLKEREWWKASRDKECEGSNNNGLGRKWILTIYANRANRLGHLAMGIVELDLGRISRLEPDKETGGNSHNKLWLIMRDKQSWNNGTMHVKGNLCWEQRRLAKDPNIVTGIEPSNLGFSYEIEIANGQLVEINKVIRGWKLEIEGHVFDIDLIPFGHGSFDLIISMDWLFKHKAEIVFHEKVVRIPLKKSKVLRVIGERPEENVRQLMSPKAKEQKQKEIVVVRNFLKVFPNDLSGLPPTREIEFRIELILKAIPVAKSPYRLTPSEMEELLGQLREL